MMPKRDPKRPKHGQRGVTLAEVVVSSTLLLVALVPLLKALTVAQMAGILIERRTQSLILAQSRLDEIRARSVYHYSDSFQQSSAALGGSYLCTVSDDRDSSLRRIVVSVGFDSDGDNQLSSSEIMATLDTYVAKRWPGS
jgi:Tfp pilus assembly protein PilV